MSANLDKSLDDLVGNRRTARRRANRRATAKAPTVGGVKKSSMATKATAKAAHPTAAASAASSKIIVSGLVCQTNTLFGLTHTDYSSLPMCLRPISRYVDRKALALDLIAQLEPFEAQTTATRLRIFLSSFTPFGVSRSMPGTDKTLLSTFATLFTLAGICKVEVELCRCIMIVCPCLRRYLLEGSSACIATLSTVPSTRDQKISP